MKYQAQSDAVIDEAAASTILYLSRSVWRYRRAIGIFTGGLVVLAALYGFLAEPTYRATVVGLPPDEGNPMQLRLGLGSLSNNLAGAAGDIGPSANETVAVLSSQRLAFYFFKKENALPVLFADAWDPLSKRWKSPGFFARTMAWIEGKTLDEGGPSGQLAFIKFNEIRRVQLDQDTGVLSVSIDWKDPVTAARWANDFVRDANDLMRERAQREAMEGLTFLEQQANKAALVDLREAIYSAATREVTIAMHARTKPEYAVKILDPAVPPLNRSWPRRSFLIILAAVLGMFLGSLGAMMWSYILEVRRLADRTLLLEELPRTNPHRSDHQPERSNAKANATI